MKKIACRLLGITLSILISALAQSADSAPAAGTQLTGVRVTAAGAAVVNFEEAARQDAMRPAFGGTPEGKVLERPPVPPDPGAPADSTGADAPAAPVGPRAVSPTPALSYAGLDDIPAIGGGSIIPPDTDGAVGLSKVVSALNNNMRIFDKATGNVVSTVSLATFWSSAGGTGFFDPKTIYDPYNNRWIVVVMSDAAAANSSINIGVSQTGDPSGAYNIFRVDMDATNTNWADFPCIGFNKNWVAINVNMFANSNNANAGQQMLVVDYAQLRAGTLVSSAIPGTGFCTSPVATYSATENTLYAPTHISSSSGTYRVDTITGTPASPVYTVGATKSRGLTWVQPSGSIVPQAAPLSGASSCGATPCGIDCGDSFFRTAPVFRSGFIYYSQTVGLPASGLTHTAVQWTKLDATTFDVADGGRVEDPTATSTNGGKWYTYSHIAVNSLGDVILGFTQCSSTQFASAAYAYRDHTDAAGTMRDPIVYKAGEDYYHKTFSGTRNRWGDYSKAQVDPSNDTDFWLLQEYAKSRTGTDDGTTGSNSSRWGTWWAKMSPPSVAPAITSANNTTFTVGTAGTFTVTATGFPVPTLSIMSGTLPSGITFTPSTGVLAGTPDAGTGGTFPLTFKAANGVNPDATQSFTLTINQTPAITSANAATFTVGTAGTFTLTATGFPVPTLSSTGALPSGITFTPATGVLSGTPDAAGVGTYPLTFKAANGVNPNATQSFTLTINQAPAITSANNASFTVGTAGTFTLTATGSPVPALSIMSGTLPSGVTFTPATGVLAGTPAAGTGGTFPLTFKAANGVNPDATQSFTLTINEAPAISSANNASFAVGTAGTFKLTATGNPVPTLSSTGTLPSGITFTPATGVLAGTPTAGTSGTYPLTFKAANGINPDATQSFTLTINEVPAITSANNATFSVGTAGNFTVIATGSPTPTLSMTGTLPSGVTFTPATGVLAGTPAAGTGGTFPLTFKAANGLTPDATQSFTLTINQASAITSANAVTFTVGIGGTFTLTATGNPVPALSLLSGTLPAGITFTPATGVLAGTPAAGTAGVYPLVFAAVNGIKPDASQNFTLTINEVPAITSANNATFSVGTAGTFTVTATGFPVPTLSVSGTLPSGVTFTPATGVLAGTPMAGTAGVYPLIFAAINGVKPDASQNFTLTVNASGTGVTAPQITSGPTATPAIAGVGQPVAFSVATSGSSLKFNWDFGDGTSDTSANPAHTYTTAGTILAMVTVSNSAGSVSGSVTVTVKAPVVGTGIDSDGDGFSDEIEKALGSDPLNPADNPGGGNPPVVQQLSNPVIKISKTKRLKLTCVLDIPANFTTKGKTLVVSAGTFSRTFKIESKGSWKQDKDSSKVTIKNKKGVVSAQKAKFTATLNGVPETVKTTDAVQVLIGGTIFMPK